MQTGTMLSSVATWYPLLGEFPHFIHSPGCISSESRYDAERWGDFWRFTPQGVSRLFGDVFGDQNVEVKAYGNIALATAVLHGLVVHEMRPNELAFNDENYPVVICCSAVRCV